MAKRLGHSDVTITLSIYAHVFEHDDAEAANRAAYFLFGDASESG